MEYAHFKSAGRRRRLRSFRISYMEVGFFVLGLEFDNLRVDELVVLKHE